MDNIKMDVNKQIYDIVNQIRLNRDKLERWPFVNTTINLLALL